MSNLSKEAIERIEKDAEAYGEGHQDILVNIYKYSTYADIVGAYQAAALHEAERAQGLLNALEHIENSPAPANDREKEIWIGIARQLASTALAKYKEVNA